MKPHVRKPQRVLVPLDNETRRWTYVFQDRAASHAKVDGVTAPTPRQARRMRKADNRADLRVKLAGRAVNA